MKTITLTIDYDAEDNIYNINNGNWQTNKNPDTWECLSNEICFSVGEDCSIICKSDKYKFTEVVVKNENLGNWTYKIWNESNTSFFSAKSNIDFMCEIANEYLVSFQITAEINE